jgi:hypothetical protein
MRSKSTLRDIQETQTIFDKGENMQISAKKKIEREHTGTNQFATFCIHFCIYAYL